MLRAPPKVFVLSRFFPQLACIFLPLLLQTHAHAHPIDEVRSNAILEFTSQDAQQFQLTVLLGREHLAEYTRLLRQMNQPPERDRDELARTVQKSFAIDACTLAMGPPPDERENGAWIAVHYLMHCEKPLTKLEIRRVGYSAQKTRTTLYLLVTLPGREPLRALVPPLAESMRVPLDGQAPVTGPQVARRVQPKDTAPGMLPSETLSPEQLAASRAQPNLDPPPRPVLLAWLREGALHLATGPDHLLFLLTLVVAAPAVPPLLLAVTTFSLGHLTSMALALLFHWPAPRWLDVAIGLTIALAALHARRLQTRHSLQLAGLTLLFGLIHGLGFGNGLQQLVVGYDQLLWPLLSFGLGLDLAQVLWVLTCTLLWRLLQARVRQPQSLQRRSANALIAAGALFALHALIVQIP